jgi:CheY-like chemotaxis protein
MTRTFSWLKPLADIVWARSGDAGPATVLVVDDEETVCRFVARVMRESGCDVVTAANAKDAMAAAERLESIDLLITDLIMPETNGDELARRLRQRDADLPVLYLTGFSDRLFTDRALLWEHEAFLDKPCSIKALLEAASLVSGGRMNSSIVRRRPTVIEEAAVPAAAMVSAS